MVKNSRSPNRVDHEGPVKILVDLDLEKSVINELMKMDHLKVEITDKPSVEARELPRNLIADKEILFCSIPPENLEEMKKLKLIQISSAGYGHLYDLELHKKGIRACNASGIYDVPIAEWNISMMINLTRNLREMIRHQEKGIWKREATFQDEIWDNKLGIWGYGNIGRETGRLAKTMGLTLSVLSREGIGPVKDKYRFENTGDPQGNLPDEVFLYDEKKEFLGDLDFLVISTPLTKSTRGMIGETELKALPDTCYVLNPARGPIIKEDALLESLRKSWIAGAALDAHHHYPLPADHPIRRFPNTIITPHISGSSENPNRDKRLCDLFRRNVSRFLDDRPLLNELTSSQLRGE